MNDNVNHPKHYTEHKSGVECIAITEHMNFCLGSAIKYIWRADLKGDVISDLRKAQWYIAREIERRQNKEERPAAMDYSQPRHVSQYEPRHVSQYEFDQLITTDTALKIGEDWYVEGRRLVIL
jgi:hypothetical protein